MIEDDQNDGLLPGDTQEADRAILQERTEESDQMHHKQKEESSHKYHVTKSFIAEGTTCQSCEKIIIRQAQKVEGVTKATFNYETETGEVTFDPKKTDIDTILYKIEEKGYSCFILKDDEKNASIMHKPYPKYLAYLFALLGIAVIIYFILPLIEGIQIPTLSQDMGYGLLFIAGLLTGFHCVGMCGGIVMSNTAYAHKHKKNPYVTHATYGLGKIISYTLIGGLFGLVGSVIAFTPMLRGIIGILAGLFLILFGLQMLNIFPALRKIRIKTPQFLTKFVGKESRKHHNPLVVGLLNGLMIACGPLQAMYIMAAGTGSGIEGAKLLFIYGLGTLPVLLGFGMIASLLSKSFTHKLVKVSGIVIVIMGILMLNNGLSLSGTGYDFNTMVTTVRASSLKSEPLVMNQGYQEIRMEVNRYGWSPDTFVIKKDVPVRWIIDGKELNGCNNAIQVPEYDLEFALKQGEQVIEFTPTKEGVIPWSCWMGMIPGSFIVKDDIDLTDTAAIQDALKQAPKQKPAGTCGAASGGSCGCGA